MLELLLVFLAFRAQPPLVVADSGSILVLRARKELATYGSGKGRRASEDQSRWFRQPRWMGSNT